ncbi:hypothetical protein CGMCC3_g16741 [Colletotrichum fructicola]|nr:uncharacterized protein CGMCC3_g16741 [Colletotrichum fructicola]KAE9567104.1 hypothetical protein CGMCC3_g16741 [Colletotrichum fructicola]
MLFRSRGEAEIHVSRKFIASVAVRGGRRGLKRRVFGVGVAVFSSEDEGAVDIARGATFCSFKREVGSLSLALARCRG